jgi:hypothetical protein
LRFEKALQFSISNLQSFGRFYFTPKQLYYEFCRQIRSPLGMETGTAAVLFGLSLVPAVLMRKNTLGLLAGSGFVLGGLAAFRNLPHTLLPPVSWEHFERLLAEYQPDYEIEGLLKIEKRARFTDKFPADLMLYGLPRVLLCESDEIAQMLRANQFNLQTPCAVLSLSEAEPLNELVKKMLERAEAPQVFFLHDASLRAFSLLPTLRKRLELPEEIPLRPLGLRPVHARRLHLFETEKLLRPVDLSAFDYLSESEREWLGRGNRAEVSAIPPVRLLRVLRRLILGLEIPSGEWQLVLPQKKLGFM